MFRYIIPLVIFAGLVMLLLYGLQNDPGIVPSPFIDMPVPDFEVSQLHDPQSVFSSSDLEGDVVLLNVWATWCIPCRDEHPILVDLAKSSDVTIYGLNYKDNRENAIHWLEQLGNPYEKVLFDNHGIVGIDLGVYGVPETFIVDGQGIIKYKHIGQITRESLNETILPLINTLKPAS